MNTFPFKFNPRKLIFISFLITIPSMFFWCAVGYSKLFHDPTYVNLLLSHGGTFLHFLFKAFFPIASLLIAIVCNKILRDQAIASNVWHRESPVMKLNQRLISWDVILISAMIISLINN